MDVSVLLDDDSAAQTSLAMAPSPLRLGRRSDADEDEDLADLQIVSSPRARGPGAGSGASPRTRSTSGGSDLPELEQRAPELVAKLRGKFDKLPSLDGDAVYRSTLVTVIHEALTSLGRMSFGDMASLLGTLGKTIVHEATHVSRHVDAAVCFGWALAFAPGDLTLSYSYGNALYRAGQYGEACACFQAALAFNPACEPDAQPAADTPSMQARVLVNLGVALEANGLLAEAATAYTSALHLFPKYALACKLQGGALLALGRAEEAEAALGAAVALQPEFGDAWADLGAARRQRGRHVAAVEALQRAAGLQPQSIVAQWNLAQAQRDAGHFAPALSTNRQQVLRLQGTLWAAHVEAALCEQALGSPASEVLAELYTAAKLAEGGVDDVAQALRKLLREADPTAGGEEAGTAGAGASREPHWRERWADLSGVWNARLAPRPPGSTGLWGWPARAEAEAEGAPNDPPMGAPARPHVRPLIQVWEGRRPRSGLRRKLAALQRLASPSHKKGSGSRGAAGGSPPPRTSHRSEEGAAAVPGGEPQVYGGSGTAAGSAELVQRHLQQLGPERRAAVEAAAAAEEEAAARTRERELSRLAAELALATSALPASHPMMADPSQDSFQPGSPVAALSPRLHKGQGSSPVPGPGASTQENMLMTMNVDFFSSGSP